MRREYMGAARKARLAAPLGGSPTDLGILGDDLTGWPVGTNPFFIVIDRGQATEEKILCSLRSANSLTVYTDGAINGRGADGTAVVSHLVGATLEHVWTATDADEANEHVNSVSNVHGTTSPVMGRNDVQTVTGKTMSGTANTFTDIPQAAVDNLVADLAALNSQKANLAGGATFTGNIVLPATTDIGPVSGTEIGYLDGATSNLQAQLNAKAPINNPTFTGNVSMPANTTIGGISPGEIMMLDGVIGNIQDQINGLTAGVGVLPVGGSTGMALVKRSNASFDVEWAFINGFGSSGGASGPWVVADGSIRGGQETGTYTDGIYTYKWHKFTTVDTVQVLEVDTSVIGTLLVVGAGGGGGTAWSAAGAGGGAGTLFEQTWAFGAGDHTLWVGSAPPYANPALNGNHSYFDGYPSMLTPPTITPTTLICYGGGRGGGSGAGLWGGADGGSGGGGTQGSLGDPASTGGGAALWGSLDGGATMNTDVFRAARGRGINTGHGGDAQYGGGAGGDNGSGHISSITGTPVTYAAGGMPSDYADPTTPVAPHTGSGGNGGFLYRAGARGSDGVIIVRYRIA